MSTIKLAFLICLFCNSLSAQIKVTEGKLFYDITYENLPADMKSQAHLLPKDASVYFKDAKVRTEMGIGPYGKNVTITDKKTGEVIALLNIFGKKFAVKKSDSEMVAVYQEMRTDTVATKVVFMPEKKVIAGYNCKRALLQKMINGVTHEEEVWYCADLPSFMMDQDPALKKIEGFFMEYGLSQNGVKMHLKVRSVLPLPMDDHYFEIPADYQVVTEEDLTRLMNVLLMQQSPEGEK